MRNLKIATVLALLSLLIGCSGPANTNKTITSMFDRESASVEFNAWTNKS